MLRCTIVSYKNKTERIMSFAINLLQTTTAMPYDQLISTAAYVGLIGGVVLFFRPLLVGIGRALLLTVRPRRPRAKIATPQAAKL